MPSRSSGQGRTRGNLPSRSPRSKAGGRAPAAVEATARRRRRAHLHPPRRSRKLRIFLITLAVLSSTIGGAVIAAFVAYASYRTQLPDAATVASMEPPLDSHVYDSKGNLIAVFDDNGTRHVHASLGNIAKTAQLATIDVEDRHFYSEGSWDLPRLVKAGWDNLSHTNTSGASTITEQLAKISFFNSSERSLDYKIKEIVLGNELDASFTKNQILEMYLNRVNYGNHAIGIETAAELYFLKPAKDLDLAQASLLAGLPQSPTVYNPTLHDATSTINPQAKTRQKVVLDSMVANGDITQKQADAALAEKLAVHSWTESNPNVYPSITDYVQKYVSYAFGDSFINPGGWDIYSTVNPADQKVAETTLHNGIAAIRDAHNARDGAMVNIDPKTGRILAMVGAWDYSDADIGQLNMALQGRSPGSTIKLFTYTAAIASHLFTMTTPILDALTHFTPGPGQDYVPLNYDRRFHGVCQVKACLGNSLNIPAVKVEAATGIPYITNLEIAAGLTSLNNPSDRPAPTQYSATLGGELLTPLELADGAATIADMGVHHDPSPVDHIIDRVSGKTVFTLDPTKTARRVVPENVAFIMNEITSNDANRVMDFGAHGDLTLPDRRVSAKTGTAEFFLDNWTVGWTPDFLSVVWVGNPRNSCLKPSDYATMQAKMQTHVLYSGQLVSDPFSPADLAQYGLQPINGACGHLDNSTGITGAAPIWNADMRGVLSGTPANWYPMPKDVIRQGGGTGDDADFFLPGTTGAGTCYYYGPDPNTPPAGTKPECVYGGFTAPPPTPAPAPAAAPTPVSATPGGNGGGGGGGGFTFPPLPSP